jgi:phage FluMu protein Com
MNMAIEFHCEHCGKLIRAGDEEAGRRGKCPHCQISVYIPTPSSELEPLQLAPLDDRDEQQERQLEEESRKLAQRILQEKDVPPESYVSAAPRAEPVGDARLTAANMENLVIEYVLCMSNGKLTEAEELAFEIRTVPHAAEQVIQRLTADQMPPPQLAKIPRPVFVRFLRQLLEKK